MTSPEHDDVIVLSAGPIIRPEAWIHNTMCVTSNARKLLSPSTNLSESELLASLEKIAIFHIPRHYLSWLPLYPNKLLLVSTFDVRFSSISVHLHVKRDVEVINAVEFVNFEIRASPTLHIKMCGVVALCFKGVMFV